MSLSTPLCYIIRELQCVRLSFAKPVELSFMLKYGAAVGIELATGNGQTC